MNSLNDALMDALGAALLAFNADNGIGAIVISGNAKAFAFEQRQLHARFASDDAHEGVKAFLDKRKPEFNQC